MEGTLLPLDWRSSYTICDTFISLLTYWKACLLFKSKCTSLLLNLTTGCFTHWISFLELPWQSTKFSGLKQKFTVSQFRSPEIWNQCIGRAMVPLRALESALFHTAFLASLPPGLLTLQTYPSTFPLTCFSPCVSSHCLSWMCVSEPKFLLL